MRQRQAGFTLIELLVTLTILGIGLAIAVPSMIGFQRSSELTSAVGTLTSAIQAARGEAMKRNARAFVVPASGGDWSTGYRAFVDINRDRTLNAGDITIQRQGGLPANLEIAGTDTAAGSTPFLEFDGSGYLRNGGGFTNLAITIRRRDSIGKAEEFAQTRHIVITQTGRVRACKPASASDANCSTTAF